jgi:hypothetical protein
MFHKSEAFTGLAFLYPYQNSLVSLAKRQKIIRRGTEVPRHIVCVVLLLLPQGGGRDFTSKPYLV